MIIILGFACVGEIRGKDPHIWLGGITDDSLSSLVWTLSGIGRDHGIIQTTLLPLLRTAS